MKKYQCKKCGKSSIKKRMYYWVNIIRDTPVYECPYCNTTLFRYKKVKENCK